MPNPTISPCFYCRSKEGWDIPGLKYALETDRLCDLHKALAEEKIKNHKEKVYELKIPGSFLPPIKKQIRPARDWNEPREPGEDG